MKKALILLLTLCMLITSVPVFAANTGEWSTGKSTYSFVTPGQIKLFRKATKGIGGVAYKPVALLAKQLVSGTNYIYLSYGTTVTLKPECSWYILSAYKNLDKKVSLNSIEKISIEDIKTSENPRTGILDGGFYILPFKKNLSALPAKARTAFRKATKTYSKYELSPIALLGKQVVAGTNYRILCYGSNSKTSDLFVVDIYEKPSGKSTVTSCKSFDLEAYVNN